MIKMPLPQEVLNNSFESKVSMKVEANSRGFNTSVHVYHGATKKQVDETVKITVYAHMKLQAALNPEDETEDVVPQFSELA